MPLQLPFPFTKQFWQRCYCYDSAPAVTLPPKEIKQFIQCFWCILGIWRKDKTGPYLILTSLVLKYGVDFHISLITFKACHGLAPSYIKDIPALYEPSCSPHSSLNTLLHANTARFVSKGDRACSVRALQLCNSLLEDLRSADLEDSFKTLLETHFNRKAFVLNDMFSIPYLVYCSYSVTFLPRDALALGGWGYTQWESVRGNFVGSGFSALSLSGACGYKGYVC